MGKWCVHVWGFFCVCKHHLYIWPLDLPYFYQCVHSPPTFSKMQTGVACLIWEIFESGRSWQNTVTVIRIRTFSVPSAGLWQSVSQTSSHCSCVTHSAAENNSSSLSGTTLLSHECTTICHWGESPVSQRWLHECTMNTHIWPHWERDWLTPGHLQWSLGSHKWPSHYAAISRRLSQPYDSSQLCDTSQHELTAQPLTRL